MITRVLLTYERLLTCERMLYPWRDPLTWHHALARGDVVIRALNWSEWLNTVMFLHVVVDGAVEVKVLPGYAAARRIGTHEESRWQITLHRHPTKVVDEIVAHARAVFLDGVDEE